MVQLNLTDLIENEDNEFINVKQDKSISKQVRDASYIVNQDVFISKRDIVYSEIMKHPEGITDQEISIFTGISLSCVNGRRNEIVPKPIPVALCVYNDDDGNSHMRTMWGIVLD